MLPGRRRVVVSSKSQASKYCRVVESPNQSVEMSSVAKRIKVFCHLNFTVLKRHKKAGKKVGKEVEGGRLVSG